MFKKLEFVPAPKKIVGNLYPFYSALELHAESIQKFSSFLAVKKKKKKLTPSSREYKFMLTKFPHFTISYYVQQVNALP